MKLSKCCIISPFFLTTHFCCLACCHLSDKFYLPGFFQVFILEELLSPVVTPIILIFSLRRKSLEIIDFFRNFTVEVVGVGDTCSFAQMDIRQHGHPAVSDYSMKHRHTRHAWLLSFNCVTCWCICPESQIWVCVFIYWPSFLSVVDVRGEDRSIHLPAGRGWKDRVISDALCHHQSPVAASSRDHAFHQPAERTSSQRGHRGPFRHTPTLAVWIWGKVTSQHSGLSQFADKYVASRF